MAQYKDATGNVIEVGNPELNPGLIAGRTLVENQPASGSIAPPVTTTPPPAPAAPMTMQGTTSPTTQPTQPGATAPNALQMPSNGSVVDLLNMAGVDSSAQNRAVLAKQFGIEGYSTKGGTAAQNQDLAKKFLAAFNATGSIPTPETSAAGRSGVNDMMEKTAPKNEQDVQANFFDTYGSMNPVEKSLYDAINTAISTPVTKTSLVDEYKALLTEQGVPALRTELLNIKKIMDGTEDDIRDEITKAGGFATESQVAALTGARNKTLLKQATNLSDQLAIQEDYVDQLMQFSQLDRKDVEDQVDRKLGLQEKLLNLNQKMKDAAKDNYQKVIDKVGFQGFADLFKGDARGMKAAEKALGLPEGSLENEAFMAAAAAKDKDLQFISGTENQQSGVFDKKTGKFTPFAGGGGGGGATGASQKLPQSYQNAIDIIVGSGKFTKAQEKAVINSINNGEDPFVVVKNQAKNLLGQTGDTKLTSYEVAKEQLERVEDSLATYYAKGGKTNIFSGNYEKTINKLGEVKDPELVEIATEIAASLQIYRNAVSGTAYSVQEGQDIAKIFPGINKTEGLNEAILNGRMRAFDSTIDSTYESVLGGTYYDLKAADMSQKAGFDYDAARASGYSNEEIIRHLNSI